MTHIRCTTLGPGPGKKLDRGFIAFTTTNPENRYIRLTNIKENNNLRDFYFRDIVLGEQREEVYNATNNAEIALAFREAGEEVLSNVLSGGERS